MATVDLVDVRKTYAGNIEAVQGINLAIGDGEMVVLVGPSGCGKSTLLRMIAGLETITSGTISIDGRVVNKEEPAERDIAMVFQNYALYPHMTVRQNLEYGLKNRGTPRPEIDSASPRPPASSRSRPFSTASLASFRVVSASVSRWVAPSCANPSAFSLTSHSRTSMRNFVARCVSKFAACSGPCALPASMSPMTS